MIFTQVHDTDCKFASVMWRGNTTNYFFFFTTLAYYLSYFPYWPSDYSLSETLCASYINNSKTVV